MHGLMREGRREPVLYSTQWFKCRAGRGPQLAYQLLDAAVYQPTDSVPTQGSAEAWPPPSGK